MHTKYFQGHLIVEDLQNRKKPLINDIGYRVQSILYHFMNSIFSGFPFS